MVSYADHFHLNHVNKVRKRSLHSLIQVTSFIGAEGVEGGNDKLPIKSAARQQPLSLFGVAGVGVFNKDLVKTHTHVPWR